MTDVGVLEQTSTDVSLEEEPPCEVKSHDHPADLVAALDCPVCGAQSLLCCWRHWDWVIDTVTIQCLCGREVPPSAARIVEVLR